MAKKKSTIAKELIEQALERERLFVAGCQEGSQRNNPQVLAARKHAEGRVDALEAVLQALSGDAVSLRIMAGK